LRSLSSVSVAAPTLMTATPAGELGEAAPGSFSRSKSESVVSISAADLVDPAPDPAPVARLRRL
jgi:hypothetical protein